jgi:hypothetical protein
MRTSGFVAAALLAGVIACASKPQTPEVTLEKGLGEMKSAIQRGVSDPGRRDKLLAHTDSLEAALRGHAADYAKFVDEFHRLNDAYDTPQEQIDAMFAAFEQKRQASRARLLELHFELIKLTSPQEWGPIGKAEVDMLQALATER